jgi:hypothetical protein
MPRTDARSAETAAICQYDAEAMRAIAADLAACGLTTRLTDSRAGLDLTAAPDSGRLREPEFWLDEDGYAELRYWMAPGTPPAEAVAIALRVLRAIAGPVPGQE